MTNKKHYESVKKEIESIDSKDVRVPNVPIDRYLQDSEDLIRVAAEDAQKLIEVGLDSVYIKTLDQRCGAVRYLQSDWIKSSTEIKYAMQKWKEKSPEAYELRDNLLHYCRFAFRKNEVLMKVVRKIAEGTSNADMVQDLSDLASLGKDNKALLKEIKMDMKLLDRAEVLSGEMADLLSASNYSKDGGSDAKHIRDKAYTHLKEAVDEIREYARFVFHNDKNRLKKYSGN